uniref:Zgc:172079 n=1 Tax=Salarias fasciatus TaxID=181472 RepID=A0A672H0S5_SALFA
TVYSTSSGVHILAVFVGGLVFNAAALVFFFSRSRSRSHTVVYMTNLAVADVLLLLTLPVRIYYHLGFGGLGQLACDVVGLVLKANMYGSIFYLTCICFDRCMAVIFPMSARVQEARKKAWLFCLGVLDAHLRGQPAHLTSSSAARSPGDDCFDALPVYATKPAVLVPTLALGFGIPLLVMLICSWGLVRAVRRSAVARTDLVDGDKIQRMIAASLLIFLLSFLPYHISLVLLFLNRDQVACSVVTAYRCSLLLACLNTVLDPVAYYFTTDTFRRNMGMGAVWRMFQLNSHSSEANSRSRAPTHAPKDDPGRLQLHPGPAAP